MTPTIASLTRLGIALILTPARTIRVSGPATPKDLEFIKVNREAIIKELEGRSLSNQPWMFVSSRLESRILTGSWVGDSVWIGIPTNGTGETKTTIEPRLFYRLTLPVLAYLTRSLEKIINHWQVAEVGRGKGPEKEREIGDPIPPPQIDRGELEEAARQLVNIKGWLSERYSKEAWGGREVQEILRGLGRLPQPPCKIELVKMMDTIGRAKGSRAVDQWVESWGRDAGGDDE